MDKSFTLAVDVWQEILWQVDWNEEEPITIKVDYVIHENGPHEGPVTIWFSYDEAEQVEQLLELALRELQTV